ncbi:MAG: hypothetical protein J6Y43_00630, partial [Clostridia bacterium]|nr:hypothetical protein [Clostridia bacterium]
SVVAFTDHNVIVTHNDLSDDKFLAITAVEMDISDGKPNHQFDKTYHLNFYSKDKDKTVSAIFNDKNIGNSSKYVTDEMRKHSFVGEYSTECINEVIKRMSEDGFLATYNHPVWSLQDYSDYKDLRGLWGIEVYNNTCCYTGLNETDTPYIDKLRDSNKIIPIAADDTHKEPYMFGGFSVIEAKKLEYGEIISAMEKGDIYSSTNPLIYEVSVDNGILSVKCDPVMKIMLHSERRWSRVVSGDNITTAEFDIKDYLECNETCGAKNTYLWLTIEDVNGKKAWTRAYTPQELK